MKRMIAIAGAALLAAAPAQGAVVDFSASTPNTFQPNPLTIGDVTFSSANQLFIGFPGNEICATEGSTCALDLNVAFSSAVSGVSFNYFGVDSTANTLDVLLNFMGGGSTNLSFGLTGSFIDLSAYSNVVGFTLSTNDPLGLSYDNFAYTLGDSAVPEPATWAMMLLGFGAVGFAIRRSRKPVALAQIA